MNWNTILIRYGEMSLKGKNKSKFVRKLKDNIKAALQELSGITMRAERDRMFLYSDHPEELERAIEILPSVFGIQSFSPIAICEPTLEAIKSTSLDVLSKTETAGKTFKVEVKRTDKRFPLVTGELQQELGGHVLRAFPELIVQMKKPEILLFIEIQKQGAYISSHIYKGAGGMPVGSNGHSLLLLSGGIDSPVAGYLMMKRGVSFDAIHFASPPFTSELAKQKVEDIIKQLSKFGATIRLHIIPFTELQQAIVKQVPSNLSMTTTRRMMMQIADRVREETNSLGLITGESLGQVASQTLDSLTAINEVTNTPILRPLIAMDKLEIIQVAEKIGTYSISIRPYEDCCTVFTPSSSKTKPQVEKVRYYESFQDFNEMMEDAVNGRVTIIPSNQTEEEFDDLL
ncbi:MULTISPECIES: tRNA uracil 4-sulfurtransferase ThiI [unclassified Sporosarcina]|uniref:tRNA uracil 4-sulfurtransferase ThiI n=1 Tax=unclassified Sporosarcina TaxID=2647733 RepID=UPI002040EA95|nr:MULTISPECIES: tRNA uracil 4-sulfurtransferase ThiI [unclassified Sporosarcina]GKV64798.1 putative tRNA sulfurtransferase [Sporosarcina sp. NCCP-2331]GLB54908.1 putative tRNA sulfurtransferase [Sporosarcina sp. NCCP-2378]